MEYTIDALKLNDRDSAHDYLAEVFEFPEYYGKNLDALYDCLGDISEPTRLYVMRDATMDPDDEYARQMDRLCTVLLLAARENDMLSVSINTVRWPE